MDEQESSKGGSQAYQHRSRKKKGLQGGMLLRRQKEKKRKVQTRKGKMRMQTQKSMIPHVESRALSRINNL